MSKSRKNETDIKIQLNGRVQAELTDLTLPVDFKTTLNKILERREQLMMNPHLAKIVINEKREIIQGELDFIVLMGLGTKETLAFQLNEKSRESGKSKFGKISLTAANMIGAGIDIKTKKKGKN